MKGDATVINRDILHFDMAVLEIFGFLESMGFSILQICSTLVRYGKDELEVNIYHGRSSYEIGFEISRKGVKYPIGTILEVSDRNLVDTYRDYAATTPAAVIKGLSGLAKLVRQYATPALEGSAEVFEELAKESQRAIDRRALEVRASQIRPRAEEAFRKHQYRQAAELYDQILPSLTPTELKKVAFAKKHSC